MYRLLFAGWTCSSIQGLALSYSALSVLRGGRLTHSVSFRYYDSWSGGMGEGEPSALLDVTTVASLTMSGFWPVEKGDTGWYFIAFGEAHMPAQAGSVFSTPASRNHPSWISYCLVVYPLGSR
ncbi:hypothetical protein F4818DRAFT_416124 [Hypoxylon cercidicola]|nr:hypothetical protein F4818DRAFT_416124 [Hypoxylon cercidicola]